MDDLRHQLVDVNGVSLHVVTAGASDGPPVVLCHGFPETWYSWRHQLTALGDAGFRAVAFDWRGYGQSSVPRSVDAYGTDRLCADLGALLDHFGYDQAAFVGHDWGAMVLWDMARMHPERVGSLFNMSVPLSQAPGPPLEFFETLFADQFFYINYFQEIGVAEAELESSTRRFVRDFLYSASGEGMASGRAFTPAPREGTGLLDTLANAPDPLPSWMSEHDVDVYCEAFDNSGFFGPLNFYRNMDDNWRRTHDVPASNISMPVGFLTGSLDPVRLLTSGAAEAMADV
jgi:pimeloyl-ACP methyl ester carboxylesterase